MIDDDIKSIIDYLRLRVIHEVVETIKHLKEVVDRYDTEDHQYRYYPLSRTIEMLRYQEKTMTNFCLVEGPDGIMWFEY